MKLLIQQATGDHQKLLDLTSGIHRKYCQDHGFDYWCIYGVPRGLDGRHTYWAKVALLLQGIAAGYEQVVWLDADTLIVTEEDLPRHTLGMTWNKGLDKEGFYDHFNCGAIYATDDAEWFLQDWDSTDEKDHPWHDQHALHIARQKWGIDSPITAIDRRWNSTPFTPSDNPAVLAWHGYGTLQDRHEAMQEAVKTFLLQKEMGAASPSEAVAKAYEFERRKMWPQAQVMLSAALSLGEQSVEARTHLASCHAQQQRWDVAVDILKDVITDFHENAEAWILLSGAYSFLGEHSACLQASRNALKFGNGIPSAHLNNALAELKEGNWKVGFEGLRYDFLQGGRRMRVPTQEGWSAYSDTNIFVWAEQGIGDTIMLFRLLRGLTSCGGKVTFECQEGLVSLLQGQIPGVTVVPQRQDGAIPFKFDSHCGMLSLPRMMEITPNWLGLCNRPYITANKEWKLKDGFNVGIYWNGSESHANNQARSISPELFDPIVQLPCNFYSLQVDKPIPQELRDECPEVTFLCDEIKDWSDTAAVIANLDLVITVDSAVAHLAGAMGKPVWILLPKSSDWRWLTDRIDSVWYPSALLYRQENLGEWEPVIARVVDDLMTVLALRAPNRRLIVARTR